MMDLRQTVSSQEDEFGQRSAIQKRTIRRPLVTRISGETDGDGNNGAVVAVIVLWLQWWVWVVEVRWIRAANRLEATVAARRQDEKFELEKRNEYRLKTKMFFPRNAGGGLVRSLRFSIVTQLPLERPGRVSIIFCGLRLRSVGAVRLSTVLRSHHSQRVHPNYDATLFCPLNRNTLFLLKAQLFITRLEPKLDTAGNGLFSMRWGMHRSLNEYLQSFPKSLWRVGNAGDVFDEVLDGPSTKFPVALTSREFHFLYVIACVFKRRTVDDGARLSTGTGVCTTLINNQEHGSSSKNRSRDTDPSPNQRGVIRFCAASSTTTAGPYAVIDAYGRP